MNGQFGWHLSAETRHERRAEGDGFGISGLDGGQGELVLRFLGLFLGPADTILGGGRTAGGLCAEAHLG